MRRRLAPDALARAAIVATALSAGCAGDDIVVYHRHEARTNDDGGDPHIGQGGAPTGSGGARGDGGHRPGSPPGAGGSGLPVPPWPPPIPFDNSGGQTMASAGGAPSAGGAGGDGGGTGGIPGVPATCQAASDCPGGFVCDELACNLPLGRCVARPIFCDATMLPVCGCDGVTYWNDCYRQQNGVLGSTPGQCSIGPATCTTSADCAVLGASCAHLNPVPAVQCGAPVLGICWVTPQDCTVAMPPEPMWMSCQGLAPGQSPRPTCVSTCAAIRSGQEYVVAGLATPGMPGMQPSTCR